MPDHAKASARANDANADTRPLHGTQELPCASIVGSILPNSTIRIIERCGSGGAGEVYRAIDLASHRSLAIKVGRSDQPLHEGFTQEIQALLSVCSPWVVGFEGSGLLSDGHRWFAMEYLDGRPLSRVLGSDDTIELIQVVRWLRQACYGLAAIHAAGWAHRDVKPSNLMLVEESGREVLKVVDLGIAERLGARVTTLSGTPEYIAPEQATCAPVDHRTDIYALGCCAYELLAGRPIVREESTEAKIDAHVRGLRVTWPDPDSIPVALRRLVERCVAHDMRNRPKSMFALEAELAELEVELIHFDERSRPRLQITSCDVTTILPSVIHPANEDPTISVPRAEFDGSKAARERRARADDAQLHRSIRRILPTIPGLHVDTLRTAVDQGVVRLWGTVKSHAELGRLFDVLGQVSGVRAINNSVKVASPRQSPTRGPADRIRRAIATTFPAARVEVAVFDYVAIVRGRVATEDERRSVEQLARSTPGVGRVINRLAVGGTPTRSVALG